MQISGVFLITALGTLFGSNDTQLIVIEAVVIFSAIFLIVVAVINRILISMRNYRDTKVENLVKYTYNSNQAISSDHKTKSTTAISNLPIFVSHSHADNDWCRIFVDALKHQGYDVWYDEKELGGGVTWQKEIEHQIKSRPLFVVVLSPDATTSQWVDEEIQLAISSRRRIIPVHYRQTVVEGFLTNRQIVDVRGFDGTQAATIVADAARRLIAV